MAKMRAFDHVRECTQLAADLKASAREYEMQKAAQC